MKKRVFSILCLVLAAVILLVSCGTKTDDTPAAPSGSDSGNTSTPPKSDGKRHLTVGYYMDGADDYYKCGLDVVTYLGENDDEFEWEIISRVGEWRAVDQLAAVEDFITMGVDAMIIVQNSPEASRESIEKANAAGIPYFALAQRPWITKDLDLAGFVVTPITVSYDIGKSAAASGASRFIFIEGALGQDYVSDFTRYILQAFHEAGKDIGGFWNEKENRADETFQGSSPDFEIVFRGSGNFMTEPAKSLMADAIVSLGPDGFDGIIVGNDEMVDGVLQAMEEAGIDPKPYWIGTSNGKEKSWPWIREGIIDFEISQTPTLEADYMFQIVKDYFGANKIEWKYKFNTCTPFTIDNIDDITLIPYNVKSYFEVRASGKLDYDVNNAVDIPLDYFVR